ncbi:MAG: DUF6421 family protein, partial [bacterium]|nr:DUF6421 family protein [bacterium]
MRPLARVLVDESHRQAWSTRPDVAARMNPVNPADASYALAAQSAVRGGFAVAVHAEGPIDDAALADADVLVLPHCADDAWEHTTGVGSPMLTDAELDAVTRFVSGGGGLVILAETEQAKYGNNLAALSARFGIVIDSTTAQDPTHCFKQVPTWVRGTLQRGVRHDLTAEVGEAAFYRAGTLRPGDDGLDQTLESIAQTSSSADPALAGVLMTSTAAGQGRVVAASDSDLFGDDSIGDLGHRQLWLNVVTWAAGGRAALASSEAHKPTASWLDGDAAWTRLVESIETLRPLQVKDGSVTAEHRAEARVAVTSIIDAIADLAPSFPHQHEHLAATQVDLAR